MYRSQAIVVREMEDHNMEDERGVRGFDLVFGSEVDRYAILPVFQFLVELANGVKKLSIGLFRRFSRIELLVDFARYDSEGAHESEQIRLAFAVRQGNIADIIRWILAWKFNIHVIIVLDRRPARSKADAVAY